jgi:hypothetical protein
MRKFLVTVGLIFCVGCAQPNLKHDADLDQSSQIGRFKITEYQQFHDGDKVRWVAAIIDTKTGREYIAVSGAGVAPLCHWNGKIEVCE